MNLLIKLLGEERLSNIYRSYASKQIKKGMKAEFQDDKGRWYYTFHDEADVPIARLAEAHTFMQFLAAGLSPDTFDKAYGTLTELFATKQFIKAGVVINDLTDLNKRIVNLDALVNIIAVNYVREDEDPTVVNQGIQSSKCDFLKSETEQGRFFFRLPMFARLLNNQTLSNEDAETFYQDWIRKQSALLKRWSILASDKLTQPSEPTQATGQSS